MAELPELLAAAARGDRAALDEMLPLVYAELHRVATGYLRRERPGHTLQPTALVHETYLRLIRQREVDWHSRAQFLGVAAQMMRRILINHAEARRSEKRGGADARVTLDDAMGAFEHRHIDVLAVDAALTRLAALDPRKARIAELRYFGGLTVPEIAEVMGVSVATVERDATFVRAWLQRELQ